MTEVTPLGRGRRMATYALCIVMVLSGPGFLALGVLLDAHVWACIAIAAVLSLVLIPLGVAMWSDVQRTARGMRRLHLAGVFATAEILSITPTSYDDSTRAELNLSISAPGIESFEVVHTREGGDDLLVGATLAAVVDATGRWYAVV